jgi:hypothetical protein
MAAGSHGEDLLLYGGWRTAASVIFLGVVPASPSEAGSGDRRSTIIFQMGSQPGIAGSLAPGRRIPQPRSPLRRSRKRISSDISAGTRRRTWGWPAAFVIGVGILTVTSSGAGGVLSAIVRFLPGAGWLAVSELAPPLLLSGMTAASVRVLRLALRRRGGDRRTGGGHPCSGLARPRKHDQRHRLHLPGGTAASPP